VGAGGNGRGYRADGPVHLASGDHWADKFKFEQVESAAAAQNSILNFIRKESFLIRFYRTFCIRW